LQVSVRTIKRDSQELAAQRDRSKSGGNWCRM
jgi:hypothetical protein